MSSMTYTPPSSSGVYGYTCPHCGQYVGQTQTHVCSQPAVRVDLSFQYLAVAQEIVALLNRLVAALEKRDD